MRTFLPIVLALCSLLFFTTCAFDMWVHHFTFHNYSENTIHVIVDLTPEDNWISATEECYRIPPGSYAFIDAHSPWSKIIEDSIYLYIIDGERVHFSSNFFYLSQDDIDKITTNDILDIITIYHDDVLNDGEDFYYGKKN